MLRLRFLCYHKKTQERSAVVPTHVPRHPNSNTKTKTNMWAGDSKREAAIAYGEQQPVDEDEDEDDDSSSDDDDDSPQPSPSPTHAAASSPSAASLVTASSALVTPAS